MLNQSWVNEDEIHQQEKLLHSYHERIVTKKKEEKQILRIKKKILKALKYSNDCIIS